MAGSRYLKLASATDCLLLCRPQEPDDEEQRQLQDTCYLNQQLTVFSFTGLKSQMMRSNGRFRTRAASIAGGSAATQKVTPRHAAAAVAS